MRQVILLLLLALPLNATEPAPRDRLWKISLLSLSVSAGLDAASSMGKPELNPLLRGRDGRFGWPQVGLKFGITAGGIAIQAGDRKHRRIYTMANFVTTGVLVGVAVRNWKVSR